MGVDLPPVPLSKKYGASWGCLGHHTSSVNFSMRPVASAVALTWESQNFTHKRSTLDNTKRFQEE